MPKLKSAKKRLRQNVKRNTKNRAKKEAYKELKRQIKKTVDGKKMGASLEDLASKFYKATDKAAKSGAIHKNKAAREKSSIMAFMEKKHNATHLTKTAKKSAKAKVAKAGKKKSTARKAK